MELKTPKYQIKIRMWSMAILLKVILILFLVESKIAKGWLILGVKKDGELVSWPSLFKAT